MHVPTKARLAVAAIAATAVSAGVAAPSFAATVPVSSGGTITPAVSGTTTLTVSAKTSATLVAPNSYDVTIAGGAAVAGGGLQDAAIPSAGTTWTLTYKDSAPGGTSQTLASGTGNTVPSTKLLTSKTFNAPLATYGSYKIALTFTNGSGTTKTTWYTSTTVAYGTATGKPTAATTFTANGATGTVNVAQGTDITFAIGGGTWPTGAGTRSYELDLGAKGVLANNTPTVAADASGNATYKLVGGYPAQASYKVTVSTFDGLNKTLDTSVLTIVVGAPGSGGGGGGGGGGAAGPLVHRIGGTDRYDTGVRISKAQFPNGGAPAVVLAVGTNFPDALAGVPFAKKVGGPLLLTDGKVLTPEVHDEIARVLATGGKVWVLGGTGAIADGVVNALPTTNVQRLWGADRYQTDLAIYSQMGSPANVVLATGTKFADALAAGPFAADVFGGGNAAILLSNDAALDPGVKAALGSATSIAAVGGQAVAATTAAGFSAKTTPFSGSDRYNTARLVAAAFTGAKTAGVAVSGAANPLQFADALTGAAYLAENNGPLLLTETTGLPSDSATALLGLKAAVATNGVTIFGGIGVVNPFTATQVANAIGGTVAP